MGSGYKSRLDRIEAEERKRNGDGVILVFQGVGDSDATVEAKIADARRARGLRADDKSVSVVVLSWVDARVL